MKTVKEMRIETERLIIRPYVEEDLMDCFNLMQDKELFKYCKIPNIKKEI